MRDIDDVKKTKYVKNMFGNISERYDLLNWIMTLGMHHKWRETAANIACDVMKGEVLTGLDIASGTGDLFFNSFGGIIEKQINGEFIVDTGHVVAFDPSLDYKITGMGSFKSTMLSGEGLVMRFTGNGKLYLQTRNVSSIASWRTPRLLG